ncbi:MAG: NAD(P)/FAD-dependent oxidoreductase [Anaerolineae bacterium]|nr:NAD(P)/FAD-dependent oxidoreductase [Anaerolineae bacterium]
MARHQKPRVVIVGAGFGGLRVAKGLRGKGFEVVVIDQHNFHTFMPLLYQVATAALEPEQVVYPVRGIFDTRAIRFLLARVESVDLAAKTLLTTRGPIDYDYLVLAAGSVTNFFGQKDIEAVAHGLKDLWEAETLRNHVLTAFERASVEPDMAKRDALLTFTIVGGGPTGVELAGALSELIYDDLAEDYPYLDFNRVKVILLEASSSLLAAFDSSLREATLRRLGQMGVDVRLNAVVATATPEVVGLKDGTLIPSHTLIWAAGVRAATLAGQLGVPQARGGRVPVLPTLQLADAPDVFVIGDMAYFEQDGQALPQVAPVAIQQGDLVAANLERLARGETLERFVYKDKGSMATIGRSAAVAQVAGLKLTGFPAWAAWLGVHLVQLIGFRNRAMVLINWGYNYILGKRGVRLITTPDSAEATGRTQVSSITGLEQRELPASGREPSLVVDAR